MVDERVAKGATWASKVIDDATGGEAGFSAHSIIIAVAHAESEAGLSTTVLPATKALPIGPQAKAAGGKLKGVITSHTPWGGTMWLSLTDRTPSMGGSLESFTW